MPDLADAILGALTDDPSSGDCLNADWDTFPGCATAVLISHILRAAGRADG